MSRLDKQLFIPDTKWLEGTFKSIAELFSSFDHFAKFIKKRYPNTYDDQIETSRGAFIIEEIDVIFVDPAECPRRVIRIGYAESKITIKEPDIGSQSPEEKEALRDRLQIIYTSIIKESHLRVMALLWKLLEDEAKEEFRREFKKTKSSGEEV